LRSIVRVTTTGFVKASMSSGKAPPKTKFRAAAAARTHSRRAEPDVGARVQRDAAVDARAQAERDPLLIPVAGSWCSMKAGSLPP
jgi:hypothetical protein